MKYIEYLLIFVLTPLMAVLVFARALVQCCYIALDRTIKHWYTWTDEVLK